MVAPKRESFSSGSQASHSSGTLALRLVNRVHLECLPRAFLRRGSSYHEAALWPRSLTLREARRYTAPGPLGKEDRLPFEPLDQYLQRKKKLAEIEALGEDPYPHRFDQTTTPAEIVASYGGRDAAALEAERVDGAQSRGGF